MPSSDSAIARSCSIDALMGEGSDTGEIRSVLTGVTADRSARAGLPVSLSGLM
jgi:hypothetical protein